jgi:glutamine amidotransferase
VKVALFDYGAGNLHSLGKALQRAGGDVRITDDWDRALSADALVLPGVGAFAAAVEALPDDPDGVRRALADGLPCLGICLGMQLLFETSEEGEGRGIGLIPGRVRRLRAAVVPQIGWNDVQTTPDPLFADVDGLVAYYANSFVCEPDAPVAGSDEGARADPAIAWSELDGRRFVAAVRRGRTWGVQFHPEKSSAQGRRIVESFIREAGR